MTKRLIHFWLDYGSAMYNKANNHQKDFDLDVILHISFIQGLNLNVIIVFIFGLIDYNLPTYTYLLATPILLSLVNSYLYYSLNIENRERLKNRKPRFSRYIYVLYGIVSAALFPVVALFCK